MKRILPFVLILFLIASCEFTRDIKENLSFLMEQSRIYGGEWSGSESDDCITIEVTNSPRINKSNHDSLDYFATKIGRACIEQFGNKFSRLKLKVTREKKMAIYTGSTSKVYSYDLEFMNKHKDLGIEEFLLKRNDYLASQKENHAEL